MDPQRQKSAAAWLSVISNTALVFLKLVIGLVVGSVSVISEAIHSGIDLLAALIALVAVKKGAKPADEGHPFGHGKIENISGTVEATLIFLAAGWIIYEAIQKLLDPYPVRHIGWGVAVMLGSAVANMAVSHVLFKVGRRTDSVALQADAWHLRTDVYTSGGVMAGLAVIWVGGRLLPGVDMQWLDPAAAIAVAMLIVHAAYKLTVQSARDLMDVTLPAQEEAWIRALLSDPGPKVRGFHRVRTRKSGPNRFIEFHIFVDGRMTVEESHHLAHEISAKIQERFTSSSVTVHVEPCSGKCDRDCSAGCLLTETQRQAVRAGKEL